MELMSEDLYEREVRRLLADNSTCRKLEVNPFPQLFELVNDKLQFAFEVDLITKKEWDI